jgi:hypothetical protein
MTSDQVKQILQREWNLRLQKTAAPSQALVRGARNAITQLMKGGVKTMVPPIKQIAKDGVKTVQNTVTGAPAANNIVTRALGSKPNLLAQRQQARMDQWQKRRELQAAKGSRTLDAGQPVQVPGSVAVPPMKQQQVARGLTVPPRQVPVPPMANQVARGLPVPPRQVPVPPLREPGQMNSIFNDPYVKGGLIAGGTGLAGGLLGYNFAPSSQQQPETEPEYDKTSSVLDGLLDRLEKDAAFNPRALMNIARMGRNAIRDPSKFFTGVSKTFHIPKDVGTGPYRHQWHRGSVGWGNAARKREAIINARKDAFSNAIPNALKSPYATHGIAAGAGAIGAMVAPSFWRGSGSQAAQAAQTPQTPQQPLSAPPMTDAGQASPSNGVPWPPQTSLTERIINGVRQAQNHFNDRFIKRPIQDFSRRIGLTPPPSPIPPMPVPSVPPMTDSGQPSPTPQHYIMTPYPQQQQYSQRLHPAER